MEIRIEAELDSTTTDTGVFLNRGTEQQKAYLKAPHAEGCTEGHGSLVGESCLWYSVLEVASGGSEHLFRIPQSCFCGEDLQACVSHSDIFKANLRFLQYLAGTNLCIG